MRTIADKRGEGRTLANIGAAYYFDSQPKLSIQYLDQALAVFRETKDRFSEGHTLQSLSQAHQALGDSERAFRFNAEALGISRSLQ